MVNIIICYYLIVLYNFFLIKYKIRKSSFKVFNIIVSKHIYYITKEILYVGPNIYIYIYMSIH